MQSDRCITCKWFAGDEVCKAFPDGIPTVIYTGLNPHTEPLPDQGNNITWQPLPEGGRDIMELLRMP